MKLYKLIYEILKAPCEPTENDIQGVRYFDDCSRCGFGDDEQISDLTIKFNKNPKTDFFSIYRQEPAINMKVKTLLERNDFTGFQIRPIQVSPQSQASECKENEYFQLVFSGKEFKADIKTRLKKNPDWCNRCKRNNNYVTINDDDPIFFNGNEIDEQDFLLCENETFPLVSERFKELIEDEGLTGIIKFVDCVNVSDEEQINSREFKNRLLLSNEFNIDIIAEMLNITINSDYKKRIKKILKNKKLLNSCESTPLILKGNELIDMNIEMRKEGFNGIKWPSEYLVIGDPNTGDFFFMNMKKNDSIIYYADHEKDFNSNSLKDMIYAENLDEFIKTELED